MLWSQRQEPCQSGFTILELILVVAILGVLSVVIMPSASNVSGKAFYERGFHDETLALLRFGQKAAIAQRRTVCVNFLGKTSVTLKIAATAVTSGPLDCKTDLQGPKSGSNTGATITAMSGVAYTSSPQNFNFDGLGQPVDALGALVREPIIIEVDSAAKMITVELVTGYTHD